MKRYLWPALLALAIQGLLFAVPLPRRQGKTTRPVAIPVEIAIRQVGPQSGGTKKKTLATPLPAPAPKIRRQPPLKIRPARPPKKAVVEKPPAKKKSALARHRKTSKIETKKETPPAFPATTPASQPQAAKSPDKAQSQPAVTAGEKKVGQPAIAGATAAVAAPGKAIGHRQAIPAYERNRQPAYPPVARRRGWSGTVLLKVLVDAKGRVADLAVERSSGHRLLDRAALKAVRQWLFLPATEDGVPMAMWVSVPITFHLQES